MENHKENLDDKKLTIQFTSTNEMPAKKAMQIMLDTYNEPLEEEYKEAQ